MSDALILEAGDARVEIAPAIGGALAAFDWRDCHVLRPTARGDRDAGDVRRHASYPLVPYSNRIAHASLAFEGRTYALDRNFGDHPHAIHGVGWQRAWTVEDVAGDSARLAFAHDPSASHADRRAWPWAFRATQTFVLRARDRAGATLAQKLTLENTADAPFPFGLGWHPFFVRSDASVLGFQARGVWLTDDTVIPTAHAVPAGGTSFDPPRRIGDTTLDNVYTEWTGTVTLDDPRRALRVVMHGDTASPYLVVYIPPGHAPFMAIEPVTHMTDAFNRLARGERDTGARVLRPGEAFTTSMQITAGALA